MAASKDYSATPLSQKLGAKPGAGVVVFFTTTREELERRFDSLKATLDPADGLWIAWPKQPEEVRSVAYETCVHQKVEALARLLRGEGLRTEATAESVAQSYARRSGRPETYEGCLEGFRD
jgi:hypothetical protein